MARIRIVAIDGEAAEVEAALGALRGVVPEDSMARELLALTAGGTVRTCAKCGCTDDRAVEPALAPAKMRRKQRKARQTPPTSLKGSRAKRGQVEEVSLEEDVGVIFNDEAETVLITRSGRGGHRHQFSVPNTPGEALEATCQERVGQDKHVCGETRRFRLA